MAKSLQDLGAGAGSVLPNPVVAPVNSPGQASAADAQARLAGVLYALGIEIPAKPNSVTPADENRVRWFDSEGADAAVVADLYGYRTGDPSLPLYSLVQRALTPGGARATLNIVANDDPASVNRAQITVSARRDSGSTNYLKILLDHQGLSDWLFNLFTSTGDLLYSSSGTAAARLPIGTINQVLTVATGSAPSWADGSKKTLSTLGDLLYASGANVLARLGIGTAGQVLTVAGGLPTWATPDGAIDRATATVDVVSSVTETTVYSFSVPANTLGTNKKLRLEIDGDYLHNNVAGDTVTVRVKFGGTTFWAGAVTLNAVLGATRKPFFLTLRVSNLGATNSQMIVGVLTGPDPNSANPTTGIGNLSTGQFAAWMGISTLGTIDTTLAQTLAVTVQWSASSANDSFRKRYATLEVV